MTPKADGKIRAILVDDEKPARELLRRLLADDPGVEIVDECASGREAVAAVRQRRPDLMFLDIRMPGHDGFGVLEELGDDAPLVVFVTAYDAYAVKAFEFHAFDYLLKPFRRERLSTTLGRIRQHMARAGKRRQAPRIRELLQHWDHRDHIEKSRDESAIHLQRVFVKTGRQSISIETDQIDWIRSVDHFVEIHARGKSFLLYASIGALEGKLDPARFLRIHRTIIISLRSVREFRLSALGQCSVILKDGTEQPVSRNRKAILREQLQKRPDR